MDITYTSTEPYAIIGAQEAKAILGVSRTTLERLMKRGQLQAIRKLPGAAGGYIFDREAVERLREERAKAAVTAPGVTP